MVRRGRSLRLLAGSGAPYLAAAAGVLLALPAITAGVWADDFVQRAVLLRSPAVPLDDPLADLFRFVPGDPAGNRWLSERGYLGWWAAPGLRFAFLRPLGALSHLVDYRLWPASLPLQHAHSLLWYALAVLAVGSLLRTVHGATAAAGLAGLLFAVDDGHALPAAWLANRSGELALVCGVLAVVAHIRWRQAGSAGRFALACVLLAAGLLAGEAALGALAYVAAWELCLGSGSWWRRSTPLVGYGVLVVAWRLGYGALGFGVSGSGAYVDPAGQPAAFATAVAERGPVLLLGQWTPVPSELWALLPRGGRLALAGIGLAVCGGLALLFARLLRRRAEARFWAGGMLLSTLPACAAFPMDRLLLFTGIGACGLLALQVEGLGWLDRPVQLKTGGVCRAATVGLLVVQLGVAAVLLPTRVVAFSRLAVGFEGAIRALPADPEAPRQTWVFLRGHDLMLAEAVVGRALAGGPVPRRIAVLAPFTSAAVVTRPDERTLEIRPDEGFLARPFDRITRGSEPPFAPGQRLAAPGFSVEVLEVTADGRPAAARFRFDHPLEDPRWRWLDWRQGAPEAFSPPAPGATVRLPATPLWDLFGPRREHPPGDLGQVAGGPGRGSRRRVRQHPLDQTTDGQPLDEDREDHHGVGDGDDRLAPG